MIKKILNNKAAYLFLMFLILSLTGASCAKEQYGGVYKSEDKGETWTQKIFIKQEGRKTFTIGDYSVIVLKFDPLDSNVLYAGTKGQGIVVSKDGAETWLATGQTDGTIYDIEIDPNDPNIMYAISSQYIIKSEDQGQTWYIIHTDPKNNKFSQIIVDSYDSNKLYASSETGIVYKSVDKGDNWDIKLQIDNKVINLYARNNDTRVLYALTEDGDVLKTETGGELTEEIIAKKRAEQEDEEIIEEASFNDAWQTIFQESYKEQWEDAKKIKNFFIFDSKPNEIYTASRHGILRSMDEGGNWEEVLTAIPLDDKSNEIIVNLKVDPNDPNTMYFNLANGHFIHKTIDNGNAWKIIENFPSTAIIKDFVIDPTNPDIIYAGMEVPEEEGGLIKSNKKN